MLEVYKDLWRSNDDRENRQSYGIANKNVRKLISGDDSTNKAAKTDGVLDSTIVSMCDRMKIPLGKILCDQGPFAPYGMCNFVYEITLPKSEKIMEAQTNETTSNYTLVVLCRHYSAPRIVAPLFDITGTILPCTLIYSILYEVTAYVSSSF